jgi:hypothetical protein
MEKTLKNYVIDMAILVSGAICGITGIVKWPGLTSSLGLTYQSLPLDLITSLHDWSGLLICIFASLHVVMHLKLLIAMTKKLLSKRSARSETASAERMRRRDFLAKLGALGLAGIGIIGAGCYWANTESSDSPAATATASATKTSTTTSTTTPTTTASITNVSSLARTCPKHKSCTSPQCNLWSDPDGNNRCDRGW